MLGLPGSSYLYQGEELGLHEVAEIPAADRQDPTFFRSSGSDLGRDGCRVPLPWDASGTGVGGAAGGSTGGSFGFGTGGAHLPQPAWFADYTVAGESGDPDSSLELYRRALALRRQLQTNEQLEWIPSGRADVLRFRRPNGWEVVTNFGTESYPVDAGDRPVLIASRALDAGALPGEATVWFGAGLS
jgi:alpha-glucosidase